MPQPPVRYTSGVNTFPAKHSMRNYPVVPTQFQITKGDDFIPFRQSTDYTATTGGTGATAAAYPWNGGAVKITCGSTTPYKSMEALGANSIIFVPGNQCWHDVRVAVPTTGTSNPANDATVYVGFFDNVDPSAATNGVYFVKPSGGSTVNFVILKAGTATTFSNIGDFSIPSGIYGDPLASNGSLAFNTTGTTYTNVTVNNPGFGYRVAPLVIATGTAGSGAQLYCQLGSSAGNPNADGQGNGSSLYSPYILAAGSGYTANTLAADILPWINLQFYYNGKGRLEVGINGKLLMSLDKDAPSTATPGQTYNLASISLDSFNFSGTSLTTGVAPVQPAVGDPYVALPQVPLQLAFGLVGTTANNRVMYVEEINIGTELN